MSEALNILKLTMDHLSQDYNRILVGGDFNARIADQNYLDFELAKELQLKSTRTSLDQVSNARGDLLVDFMEEYGFLVLNGRTPSDIPGQFTYVSKVGKSVVDLVWSSLEFCSLVLDLSISDSVLNSDHIPVSIKLDIVWQNNGACDTHKITSRSKYIWAEEKKDEFREKINQQHWPEDEKEVYYRMKEKILQAAQSLGMLNNTSFHRNQNLNPTKRPWFNNECRKMKKTYRYHYRQWRRGRRDEDLELFLELKRNYNRLCRKQRNEYQGKIMRKLNNIRNSGDFWKTIGNFRPKKEAKCNQISIATWYEYLKKLFPPPQQLSNWFHYDARREPMDSDFCLGEIKHTISYLKNNKSSGPDNILNEYIKSLGENWMRKLLDFFNYIFDGGEIPADLTKSNMFMLYKKGEVNLPDNYRSIALLNSVFKIFTHMISQRILSYGEDNKLFIEAQAGFRPGRGCTDNVFTLASIINIHLIKHRKLYVGFVDFKSAFSEIDHTLLWQKLYEFGISSKIIRVLNKMYEQAEVKIVSGRSQEATPACSITKGVLQGDSISPLLFIIFLNDIEEYFRSKGTRGVSINHVQDILLLLYADDLVVFASDKMDLQRKLNILQEYCQVNKMTVNVTKSKVVIFRRGGRVAASDKFQYNGEEMEVVSEYNYLGIMFSSHGVFHKASQQALSKGRVAMACVRKILVNSKMTSFESRVKLFDSIVKSTLLYGAEVWGLRYEDTIEKCQTQFFKSRYYLSYNTALVKLLKKLGIRSVPQWLKDDLSNTLPT
ncbi:hypothetical protein M8J77_011149 [Diaphorina citri]|nr:hypothetical protein M8J77_011149 [Diaphorina citri]